MIARLTAEERARDAVRRRPGATSWRPSRTTCGRRSPRCSCWPRRSETTSSTASSCAATSTGWAPTSHALSALIDDLFELSRLEAGDITWSLHQVELHELVGETIEAMRSRPTPRGSTSRPRCPQSSPLARANPEKLQRVLFNLIQNAIRHTPADGSVVVRAEPAGGGIEIEVADTGSGIAPGDRDRVFTAFYRGGKRRGALGRGRRPRAGGVQGDRRGPRGPDLARGLLAGHAGALQPPRRGVVRPS